MVDEKDVVSEQDGNGNETKKENGFSAFWKKAKSGVKAELLEGKIQTAYSKDHRSFELHMVGEGAFGGSTVYGEINGTSMEVFGAKEIEANSLIYDYENKKAYWVLSCSPIELEIKVEEETYKRPGRNLLLDPEVKKVQVIKAGGDFYLYDR